MSCLNKLILHSFVTGVTGGWLLLHHRYDWLSEKEATATTSAPFLKSSGMSSEVRVSLLERIGNKKALTLGNIWKWGLFIWRAMKRVTVKLKDFWNTSGPFSHHSDPRTHQFTWTNYACVEHISPRLWDCGFQDTSVPCLKYPGSGTHQPHLMGVGEKKKKVKWVKGTTQGAGPAPREKRDRGRSSLCVGGCGGNPIQQVGSTSAAANSPFHEHILYSREAPVAIEATELFMSNILETAVRICG